MPHLGCESICRYCNQGFITGVGEARLEEEVKKLARVPLEGIEIGLYGGNILGLQGKELERLFLFLGPWMEKVESIRLSTKPRDLDRDTLDVLKRYKVRTIELGIPAFNDSILESLGRNHSVKDLLTCYETLKEAGFECALQVMVGLPQEDFEDVRKTVEYLSLLRPVYVRIYPLVVLKGTALYQSYLDGEFVPISFRDGLRRALFIYLSCLKEGIKVLSMGLQEGKLLREVVAAGLYHPCFGSIVKAEAFFQAIFVTLDKAGMEGEVEITIGKSDVPHLWGYRRHNIERFERSGIRVKVKIEEMEKGSFVIRKGGKEIHGLTIDALHSPIFQS